MQSITENFYRAATDVASSVWEKAQQCVGVRKDATTTEKTIRVYNAAVATLVTLGWAHKIANEIINLESTSDPYQTVWDISMIALATGEYLSDVAFHVVASKISENSSTEAKVAATALDILRLGIIGKLAITQPPLSTIPTVLNYTDIANHLANIGFNTGQLQKIENLFATESKHSHAQ